MKDEVKLTAVPGAVPGAYRGVPAVAARGVNWQDGVAPGECRMEGPKLTRPYRGPYQAVPGVPPYREQGGDGFLARVNRRWKARSRLPGPGHNPAGGAKAIV